MLRFSEVIISLLLIYVFYLTSCTSASLRFDSDAKGNRIVLDTATILLKADTLLSVTPKTITSFPIARSAGSIHDYYSEGRYWWPNPDDPDGPYIRKDGQSNPNLFTKHRNAVSELANAVSALTVAYLKTGEQKYATHAKAHVLAWYVNAETRMNPRLDYSQAIKGINEGRGIGIIDTRSFIYVARSIELLHGANVFSVEEWNDIQKWFSEFGDWLTTSQFGIDERDNNNNHSTWWGAQLAAFGRVADRKDLLDTARVQYQRQLQVQMNERGVFPEEVSRTRPFHYTKYNLDAFTVLAKLLSEEGTDLWAFTSAQGDLRKAIDWYMSFNGKLEEWPYPSDLEPELAYHPAEYLLLIANQDSAYAKTFISATVRQKVKYPERLTILTWPVNYH